MKKGQIGVVLCAAMLVMPMTAQAASAYRDVEAGEWYAADVQRVTEAGLMSGTGTEVFAPEEKVTRGTVLAVLYRLEGEPTVETASTAWYGKAQAWAAAEGWAEGDMEAAVTREELVMMLYRYAQHKGQDVSNVEGMAVYEYEDWTESLEAAWTPLRWAYNAGILRGRGEWRLEPQGKVTRAELAAVINRYAAIYEK